MSKLKDIDKLEELPQKESRKHALARHDIWNTHHSEYHKVDGKFPYENVDHILRKYKGRSFDDAFSAYCQIAPPYQQKYFLQEFEKTPDGDFYGWYEYWSVDKKGNIQLEKKEKLKPLVEFTSDDYKIESRHKTTGHKMSDFVKIVKTKKLTSHYYKRTTIYEYGFDKAHYDELRKKGGAYLEGYQYNMKVKPKWERYTAKQEDFEPVVVKGWIKYFKSKNDREFKRLMAERMKKKKKEHEAKYGGKKISDGDFRTILRKKDQELKRETAEKLEAKGMRPNAFTRVKTDAI